MKCSVLVALRLAPIALLSASSFAQVARTAAPAQVARNAAAASTGFSGAAELDDAINEAIRQDKLPGGVLLVGHAGKIVYRKAYGYRSLVGVKEPMTVDTIFDLASLTKIVATTSAMMRLYEQGRLDLEAPVAKYLPEFQGGESPITIRELMTHFSGFRADIDIDPPWSGYETGIRMAMMDKPVAPPNSKFIYSDTNFMLLGEIARKLSGKPENEYVKDILLKPLGMKDTRYLPPASWRPRIAPTEMQPDGTVLRGVVHDPRARWMGGVAGHAGLFSTADDLAKFCTMILEEGGGLFAPATIRKFTSAASPADNPVVRGLGWDINSPYSGTRGELFPIGSFGHTGFTGTSIWIDPGSRTFVIFLANSVHPHLRSPITPLRKKIATIVAASVGYAPQKAAAGQASAH
jgi:CubicO group peptidase (beta-lactamase class C family)